MNSTIVKLPEMLSCYIQTNYSHKYCIVIGMNNNRKLQNFLLQQYNILPGLNSTTIFNCNDEMEILNLWNKIKSVKEITMSLWYKGIFQDKNR